MCSWLYVLLYSLFGSRLYWFYVFGVLCSLVLCVVGSGVLVLCLRGPMFFVGSMIVGSTCGWLYVVLVICVWDRCCSVLCFLGSLFVWGSMCVGSVGCWFYVLLVQVRLVLCSCGPMFLLVLCVWRYALLVLCFLGYMRAF